MLELGDGLSTACRSTIGRRVGQGCSVSPLMYLIYDEAMITETADNIEAGISVGDHISSTIRYADDIDKELVANSQKGLQQQFKLGRSNLAWVMHLWMGLCNSLGSAALPSNRAMYSDGPLILAHTILLS